MIDWNFVPLHLVVDEIRPNVARHHTEISEEDGSETPDIDWDTYLDASRNGVVHVVTARDDGKLVGYGVFVISTNLRYKAVIEATSNGVFIEKRYRGRLGTIMRDKADEYLKAAGVHETSYILSGDRFAKLLQQRGYQSTYKIWTVKYGQ